MKVHGVLGELDVAELGQTLVHEHIVTADWSLRMAFGERFYQHDLVADRAVEHFLKARDHGVRTIVDGTPVNMGRDVRLVREVAERTGLNFIVSSGFYFQDEVYLTYRSPDEIHEWLSTECRDGIAGTDIRPGIMKVACADNAITPVQEKVLRAVGRVAAEQGLPIFAHHHTSAANGEGILDLLEEAGAAASQVVLGHSGDTNDLDYLERLLRRGCYLGMDRFGHCAVSNSLTDRVATIAELCARGHADRLLLSHDLATYWGVFGTWQDFVSHDPLADGVDFSFIHREVLPALDAAGVEPGRALALLEQNPAELFTIKTASLPS
ncbi:phosphotriesterase family protein [Nocardioides alcanivorans]|uniref:phosphotriesterase family protein n=1 Tax=Nocardioides alcanivorans TaxID=2897352 RepID=UPI001F44917B|nr:amidohydrolase family protein [Nocardioides alcanivorans]